jgi:putative ABC transport system permease protein
MQSFIRNLHFQIRQLAKTPAFTLTVVLTLALGIGATTTMFSLVEGILLRPLPFLDPDRLVLVGDHLGESTYVAMTAREVATYSSASTAFSSMGAFIGAGYELSGGAAPEEVNASRSNASVFPTLGVEPMLGRVFTRKEEDARQPLAVIGYTLWRDRFRGDRKVLGSSIELDRKTFTIIGVMPRDFDFPVSTGHLNQTQLWVPLSLTDAELSDQNNGFFGYHMVARIRNGVTPQQAAEDANRVAAVIMRNFPPGMSALRLRGDAMSLREDTIAEARPVLETLFLAVCVVLLIACANVAGLMLVRAIRHRREYAVRLALGARTSAILRDAALEGLLLSVTGGLLGLSLTLAALRTVLHLLPESMPRVDSITISAPVAGFALLLALVTGALCSLAPGFVALRTNLTGSLKEGGRTGAGGANHSWLRSGLVVAEIAIALMLMTLCGAFVRSYQKMLAVDPGFQPEHVLVAGFQLPMNQYPTDKSVDRFRRAVLERLKGKPGLVAAGISDTLPATNSSGAAAYTVEGRPTAGWKLKFASFEVVYGGYFEAMGIRLREGRFLNAQDSDDSPLVAMVNETMARECWPGQPAIGKRIHVGNPKKGLPWATVVGVVADTKVGSRDEPGQQQWYISAQQPAVLYGYKDAGKLTNAAGGFIAVRSMLPPEQLAQNLRSTVAAIDPLIALQQMRPMTAVVASTEAPRRFNTEVLSAFALGAVLLAVTGVYAVVAFSISLRTQEIAIRMALGAQRVSIARLVLVAGLKLACIGCILGVGGSLALSRLVGSFLFGVSATDPFIFAASVAIMMLMAMLASALPAMRAAAADPIAALRSM